jgi:hypothetical protein
MEVGVLIHRIDIVIGHVLGTITAGRHRTPVGTLEEPLIAIVLLDAKSSSSSFSPWATRVSARALE